MRVLPVDFGGVLRVNGKIRLGLVFEIVFHQTDIISCVQLHFKEECASFSYLPHILVSPALFTQGIHALGDLSLFFSQLFVDRDLGGLHLGKSSQHQVAVIFVESRGDAARE